jgi:hypothetical protein
VKKKYRQVAASSYLPSSAGVSGRVRPAPPAGATRKGEV